MVKWDLNTKVVVITGAAGGLGRAISEPLAKKGCKLALLDLSQATVDEMAAGFDKNVAAGWAADVRDMDQLNRVMRQVAEHFGRIDVVVAGAGIECFYPTMELSDQAFEKITDINMNGVFRTFKAAFPWIQETKGYLLTISSMAAFVHLPYLTAYAATKASVYAFSNSLRSEMEPFGVDVGSIHPTWFETPLFTAFASRPPWKHFMNDDKGLLATRVDISVVRDAVVKAIQDRATTVVVPWLNKPVGLLAPMIRGILGYLGPTVDARKRAYEAFMNEPNKL